MNKKLVRLWVIILIAAALGTAYLGVYGINTCHTWLAFAKGFLWTVGGCTAFWVNVYKLK